MSLKQTIVEYAPPHLIHWGKCIVDPGYRSRSRHLARLRSVPRYQPTTTGILGQPLDVIDTASFISMYHDIFQREIYRFRTNAQAPYIIDCGANIGLSIVYFKRLYPQSQIVAFEPDKEVFEVLQRNLERFGYDDVGLQCRAVWNCETTLSFVSDGADGGRLSTNDTGHEQVQTVRLRDFLDREVNFLKVDIEGAESEVLLDCADRLDRVESLFVEYHSFEQQPQSLDTLTGVLREAGFRLHVHPVMTSPHPFMKRESRDGMDLQLNVFAFRP